jgi:hypothetical protein
LLGVFGEKPKADEKALSHLGLVFLHNKHRISFSGRLRINLGKSGVVCTFEGN